MDSDEERARLIQNQPYDESLDVNDAEEIASTYSPTPRNHPALGLSQGQGASKLARPSGPERGRSRGSTPPQSNMSENSEDEFEDNINQQQQVMMAQQMAQQKAQQQQQQMSAQQRQQGVAGKDPNQQSQQFNSEDDDESGSETSDEDDEDDDDDDDDDEHPPLEGAYDPVDYENLPVTPEIKELFQYITRYTPQTIELDHKLKPFIPDFIPAVGDIDAFIKIIRPDSKPDTLGLTVLDEPCSKQSDPTVLDLQLRAISKQSTDKKMVVKSLDSAEKNPKQIENWIESIRELHRSKPPPNVHYSKNMPDIDTLMQEWPAEFEDVLKEVGLPTAELDCDLSQYVELVCSILDIPIYRNSQHHNEKVQALHVLFTLYSEFKNSQHFRTLAEENRLDNSIKDPGGLMTDDPGMADGGGGEERLVL